MEFTIGCTLRYQVEAPTPFVFNLEAARLPRQRIVAETLTTSPDLGQPDRFDAPESGNRFIRYVVPAGEFQIDYRAQIALDPLMLDPTGVTEIPGGSLPLIAGLLISFGIPPEGIGIVLGVDRLLDMLRTTVNVGSDLVTAKVIDSRMAAAT